MRYFVEIRRVETEYPHATVSVESPDAETAKEYVHDHCSEIPDGYWHYNYGEGEITVMDVTEDPAPVGDPDFTVITPG